VDQLKEEFIDEPERRRKANDPEKPEAAAENAPAAENKDNKPAAPANK
jgi:hypothetical protein